MSLNLIRRLCHFISLKENILPKQFTPTSSSFPFPQFVKPFVSASAFFSFQTSPSSCPFLSFFLFTSSSSSIKYLKDFCISEKVISTSSVIPIYKICLETVSYPCPISLTLLQSHCNWLQQNFIHIYFYDATETKKSHIPISELV